MEVCLQQLGVNCGGGQGVMGQGGHGQHTHGSWQSPRGGCSVACRVTARRLTVVLSVQILCAKQGLRLRRRLTRASVKEKVKETRKVLAKLRFMAQEVQGEPRFRAGEGRGKTRALGCRCYCSPELELFLCCLPLLRKIPSSSCWKPPYFM